MALTYRIEGVKNFRRVCIDHEYRDGEPLVHMDGDYYRIDGDPAVYVIRLTTHHIIWSSMSVGMGKLTDQNIAEWWARYVTWCALHKFAIGFTLADLRRHKGLHTNWGSDETRTQWRRRVIDSFIEDIRFQATQELSLKPEVAEAIRNE